MMATVFEKSLSQRHLHCRGMLATLALLLSFSAAQGQDVSFIALPQDLQLYPRDLTSNRATVTVEGEIATSGYDAMVLKVYRDGALTTTTTKSLNYNGGTASFIFTPEIEAELKNYDFEVYAKQGNNEQLVERVEEVAAGDVLLVQGQSNAVARRRSGSDSANPNQGSFLRSFGTRSKDSKQSVEAQETESDLAWHLAEGNNEEGSGAVGQWSLRLGRLLINQYDVPIAIINGARGGKPISYFQRNDSDPDDLMTNYGRLLFRAQKAGVEDDARAMLWYQGESGEYDLTTHENNFDALYDDWKTDYPGIEKVYTYQIRKSLAGRCGSASLEEKLLLRDLQRRIPDNYSDVEIMSTTGVDGYESKCHFLYQDGYEVIASNIFGQVARDLYGSSNTQNIDPPNVQSAFFSNGSGTEITLQMRDANDGLVWENGAENDFELVGTSETVTSGSASGSTIVLTLSGDASDATAIRYVGHTDMGGPWVTNVGGVGLLAFSETIDANDPLPVELVVFEAIVNGLDVLLQWETVLERNNAGFVIERAVGENMPFTEEAFVAGHGTTLEAQRYRHKVNGLPYGSHRFRLKQLDHDGTVHYSPEIEATIELPSTYELSAAYPNPFNPRTQFTLTVAKEQRVTVEVVDMLGRQVALLHDGPLRAEETRRFSIEAGDLASGVYLYRAVGESFADAKQVVLIK